MNSRRTRLRSTLAVLLTVLVLVPTGILFTRVWQDTADRRDSTRRELQGVQYLTALSSLVVALTEAQSTALQGVAEPPGTLRSAVDQVSEVDRRLGAELQTTASWTNLKGKIEKLSTVTAPVAVFQAYTETGVLILEMYRQVRIDSELGGDPDNDISHLQQAVAVDMPTTIVRVNRMGDLANMLPAVPAAARAQIGAQFAHEVLTVRDTVAALTANLQDAVKDTNSSTLSGSLVNTLDAFRRGVESMLRGANPGGAPDGRAISVAQNTMKAALNSLSGVILQEMERLLVKRRDALDRRRIEAIVLAGITVVLVTLAVLLTVLGRRPGAEPAAGESPVGATARDGTPGRPGGFGVQPYDQAPVYGEANSTRRERFGALR